MSRKRGRKPDAPEIKALKAGVVLRQCAEGAITPAYCRKRLKQLGFPVELADGVLGVNSPVRNFDDAVAAPPKKETIGGKRREMRVRKSERAAFARWQAGEIPTTLTEAGMFARWNIEQRAIDGAAVPPDATLVSSASASRFGSETDEDLDAGDVGTEAYRPFRSARDYLNDLNDRMLNRVARVAGEMEEAIEEQELDVELVRMPSELPGIISVQSRSRESVTEALRAFERFGLPQAGDIEKFGCCWEADLSVDDAFLRDEEETAQLLEALEDAYRDGGQGFEGREPDYTPSEGDA